MSHGESKGTKNDGWAKIELDGGILVMETVP